MLPILLVCAALAGPRVDLEVDRDPAAGNLAVRVENPGPGPILVPACETLQIEIFDPASERWVSPSTRACHKTEPAIALGVGSHSFTVPLAVTASSLVRVVLVYGVGCREGLPLEASGCATYDAAISRSLTAFPADGG